MNRFEEKKFFHISSAGENVVFRDELDFIQFMNDIPLAGFSTLTDILAFIIMSTHFHLCVVTEHINEFVRILKRAYTRYFFYKYGIAGKIMDVDVREKTDVIQKVNALSYVLKNPVHHGVSFSPFQYPYSSIGCYFHKQLSRVERYRNEYISENLLKPSELNSYEKRAVLRKYILPDTYLIKDKKLIVPESYIDTRMTEAFYYNSYKSFLVEMNRNQDENTITQEMGKHFVTTESLLISSQRISDIEVCKFIAEYVKTSQRKSFKDLTSEELSKLCQLLQKLGANRPQIERCLWL